MARKIPVKLVMQYREQGLSRNMIAKTQKVGKSSVSVITAYNFYQSCSSFYHSVQQFLPDYA